MLDPVLEIYVIWHPDDAEGAERAQNLVDHFHGTAYSGLIGGAVEVYVRSVAWSENGAPRPLPFQEEPRYGIPQPAIFAVVPIIGLGLARTLSNGDDAWRAYLQSIAAAHDQDPARVGVYPIVLERTALDQEQIREFFGGVLALGSGLPLDGDRQETRQIRDLVQGIAQQSTETGAPRIKVFISHTKRATEDEGEQADRIDRVFETIARTRLDQFFDATDLQPGGDWAQELESHASTGALLCVRTDLYSSREWCQREISVAKRAGVPVVILDSLQEGEKRGSFLMDHVPRIPGNSPTEISEDIVIVALNQLVDECLKRELWRRQHEIAKGELCDWWAPHAPELLTFVDWLRTSGFDTTTDGTLRILHPDPPLGRDEVEPLREILALLGSQRRLEVVTPRTIVSGSE